MKSTILILLTFPASVFAQTITHITQLSIYTDLPLCLGTAVDLVYEDLRTSACPQTNPSSAASCLCLKTVNSQAISMSMSIYAMIMCAGSSGTSEGQENLSSGLAVFSEYCTEALGNGMQVTSTQEAQIPAQTGAGRTTNSTISTTKQNNSPASSPASLSSVSSSSSTSTGLSLAEKIAIGVSIPATLAAVIGAYFAWKQHTREKKKAQLAAHFVPGPLRYPAPRPTGQLTSQ
ncbi:unnamed protein product [Diplocarpon coronariae]|nr:hypothetical protein JHW43_004247 [Diplocarpon mali]